MGGLGPLTKSLLMGAERLIVEGVEVAGKSEASLGKVISKGFVEADTLLGKAGTGKALQKVGLFAETEVATGGMTRKEVLANLESDLSRRQFVNPAGYAKKVEALSSKPFSFFRGTAPQFYRRLFSEMPEGLRNAPKTMLQGDVHIENFAAIPGKKALTYGLTDFDESLKGPASVDLVRGMSSIVVAAGEDTSLLKSFLKGYRKGLDGVINLKSDAVGHFLKHQGTITQAEMLAEETMKGHSLITPTEMTKAIPKDLKAKFATALSKIEIPSVAKRELQDVVKIHGGTGSLDLFRYEGVLGKGTKKDVILEMKELLPSSLSKHLGASGNNLARYEEALSVYQGKVAEPVAKVTVDGRTFLAKVRQPYKGSIKFADVKGGDQKAFLEDLGKILGKAHANGGNGQALETFVKHNEDDLMATAIKQARHSLTDYQTFLSR